MLERRLARVAISHDLLFDLMTEGHVNIRPWKVAEGIPSDAVFISSHFDERNMQAYLTFTHPSFHEVPVGSVIPFINVRVTTFYKPEAEKIYEEHIKQCELESMGVNA